MQTRRHCTRATLTVAALLMATTLTSHTAAGQQSASGTHDWSAVDRAFGRKGAAQPGGVMKYNFPRSDLHVTANGVQVKPSLALGSWVALEDIGGGRAMAMGDLVLTEEEAGPVMRSLQHGGVQQTALHNHILHESPRVMYMHIAAQGDPVKIAQAIRSALEQSKTPLSAPAPPAPATPLDLDTAGVARALGVTGKVSGGVYQVSVPRQETIRENGHEVPPSMGVATGINFQPTGGGKAAITGDFVMRASEVTGVIRALQQSGIEVTALHSHMMDEEPRLFFMHFWANDDAVKLAQGLRSALDQMAVKRTAAK
jgi:hypothetical protein